MPVDFLSGRMGVNLQFHPLSGPKRWDQTWTECAPDAVGYRCRQKPPLTTMETSAQGSRAGPWRVGVGGAECRLWLPTMVFVDCRARPRCQL
jgi:hypothetical protein